MLEGTPVTFRHKLEEISKQLEHCKLERQRRHSVFIKRFDDIVARHERLTSGRLRRLSMEGIFVDINTIKRSGNDTKIHANTADLFLPDISQATNDISKKIPSKSKSSESAETTIQIKEMDSYYAQDKHRAVPNLPHNILPHILKLELQFDCKHPQTSGFHNIDKNLRQGKKTPDLLGNRGHRTKMAGQTFHKIMNIQKLTSLRRHQTVLTMSPVDIGEDSEIPVRFFIPDNGIIGVGKLQANVNKKVVGFESANNIKRRDAVSPLISGQVKLHKAVRKIEVYRSFQKIHKTAKNNDREASLRQLR